MTNALSRMTSRMMLPILALPVIAGCTSGDEFPSLARRPPEKAASAGVVAAGTTVAHAGPVAGGGRFAGSAPVVSPAPDATVTQAPVSADLTTRLAQLQEAARAAHGRFDGNRARAAQLVSAARGAATASEAWSVATVAIADLESARSDAMVSLGELDRLYVGERIDGGDGVAIAAVRDQVTAWVADEDAVLADLGGRLGG